MWEFREHLPPIGDVQEGRTREETVERVVWDPSRHQRLPRGEYRATRPGISFGAGQHYAARTSIVLNGLNRAMQGNGDDDP
jgi:hypothetical protein